MTYYPFNGKDREVEKILYEDEFFLVSFGYDKVENCYHIGLRWQEVKGECKAYPIGQNGKPQWFRLRDSLAIDFLQMLKNRMPQNNEKIYKNEIDKAIAYFSDKSKDSQ